MYYIPRTLFAKDEILGEDRLSKFKSAYPIEMYFDNVTDYAGQGNFIQKFGLFNETSATFTVARRRWDQLVGRFGQTIIPSRPCEGDLLYFPLTKHLFEIKFTDHLDPFYQLGKLYIYKLEASKYWWVRYFVNGNAVRKTTKTESKREAIAFAKTFYDTVTYNQRHGISSTLSATSFAVCLKEMLKAEKAKLERGEISKITFDNSNYRYEKSITPFFGKMEVKDIDYMCVDRYLNELSSLANSVVPNF
jgi:hypothetical protein